MTQKIMDKILDLQVKYEKHLPESIRNDADAIEYSLAGHDEFPTLNDMQMLAGDIVLWTVEMFEAYEEGELDDEGDEE